MTTGEFLLNFNLFYNNITSNQAPGLNEYEISTFLTRAQEEIVDEIYNGRFSGVGFEKHEDLREFIRPLLKHIALSPYAHGEHEVSDDYSDADDYYKYDITTEDDILYIVMEKAIITYNNNKKTVHVIPIKYDDFLRTYKNPFRGFSKKRVLRVDAATKRYLYSQYSVYDYSIDYLKVPKPIIIGSDDFSGYFINNQPANVSIECELHPAIHQAILIRAVELAKAAWQSK